MIVQSIMGSTSGLKSLNRDKLERLREAKQVGNSFKTSRRSQLCNFVIFLSLLSVAFVKPTNANTECTLTVLDLPFSEELSNPCALVDDESLHRDALTEEARENARRTAVGEIKAKTSQLKNESEAILNSGALEGCSSLQLPLVAAIPTPDDISESTPLKVLRLFYTSLLKHAAHVYYMAEQLDRYSKDGSSCISPDLFNSTQSLAFAMRNLICSIRFSTVAIQGEDEENSFEELTVEVLGEKLADQSLCSRRNLRDCQTIRSTITVLQELLTYLQTAVFDATTVFGEL